MRAFLELSCRRLVLIGMLILGLMQTSFGATSRSQPGPYKPLDEVTLDTTYLSELMEERSYSTLIPYFEDLLQNRRYTGRIDSIFLLKNLGRMAITDSATREKGKAYLARAAAMSPGTAVWDVYDAQLRQDYAQANEVAQAKEEPPLPSTPMEEKPMAATKSWYHDRGFWWAAGGLGVAMIAVTITYLLMQDSQSEEHQEHALAISTNSR